MDELGVRRKETERKRNNIDNVGQTKINRW